MKKMTIDEAIEILNNQKYPFPEYPKDVETNMALEMAIEALKEHKQGEWIPIEWKDEETKCKIIDYPYDGKWVIVTDGKNISVERIKIDAIDHFYPAGRWFELEDVIAWMPLPELWC